MKDIKIQWHPAFVSAMDLELKQNRDDLIFEKEYNLNAKPLEIDLLVIKKEACAQIVSDLGKIFKGHNIVEYKSPEDHLDIDTFYKSLAYACLYKSYGKTVDAIKAEDITISIIREAKPIELFRYFENHECTVTDSGKGIYYESSGFHSRDGHPAAFSRDYGRVYYESSGFHSRMAIRPFSAGIMVRFTI